MRPTQSRATQSTAPTRKVPSLCRPRAGFSLIELLVVIAIISMLLYLLVPAVGKAREQGRKAVCLSNLRSIGQAVHQYAGEDAGNHAVPMHPSMLEADEYWIKRTAMWFSWGGRAAPEAFLTASTEYHLDQTRPFWSSRERPLTLYLRPGVRAEEQRLDVFRCPSDAGYPDIPSDVLDDAPQENADRPLYDTLGNSYRGSLSQLIPAFEVESRDRFALGVWGQRLDALHDTARMLWGGEPLLYNFIGTDQTGGWPDIRKFGWHGDYWSDNQLFVDGGARVTRAASEDDAGFRFAEEDYATLGVDPRTAPVAIRRGPGWKIDCYPTPGVRINDFNVQDHPPDLWPWRGHRQLRGSS